MEIQKDHKEIEKLYHSIGEIAKKYNVSTSLIRYWEKEFDILKPRKNKKGDRLFTQKDLENLDIIYHLIKERGFTLKGAKKKIYQNKEDNIGTSEIVRSLKKIREFLIHIRDEL